MARYYHRSLPAWAPNINISDHIAGELKMPTIKHDLIMQNISQGARSCFTSHGHRGSMMVAALGDSAVGQYLVALTSLPRGEELASMPPRRRWRRI